MVVVALSLELLYFNFNRQRPHARVTLNRRLAVRAFVRPNPRLPSDERR